jgi:hypothetical protein
MLKVFWADETLRLAFADVEKNRAKAFIVSYFYHFWDACMHRLLPGQPIPPDFPPGWPVNWRWADVLTQFFASLDPSFFSYRQARASPYMDTVVFKPYPCIKQISHEQTVRCFLAKHEGGHGPLPPEEVLDGLRPLATKVMRKIAEARIEHDRKRAKA